jgi:hypothetical protein
MSLKVRDALARHRAAAQSERAARTHELIANHLERRGAGELAAFERRLAYELRMAAKREREHARETAWSVFDNAA